MIGFYATLAPRLGSGPYWNQFMDLGVNSTCRVSWLSNVLYINNYRFGHNGMMVSISLIMMLLLITKKNYLIFSVLTSNLVPSS
jgi:hypothetical protein